MRLLLLGLLILFLGQIKGQAIDGCPLWGCRPSGTFSFSLDVPRTNATVDWVSDFFIGPVPEAAGCVGNSESLVCQSNGPGPADTGYMGIDAGSGAVRWRDPILRFPTLPVMDTYGDVWGTDGGQVMSYDNTGKPIGPQIPVTPNMRPLFDMQIINGNTLLMVSQKGEISMLLTDGTPFASTILRGTVERDNGTFLPTAAPVVNGNRFYVITEFSPDNTASANLGLQRLYAIDTHQSLNDRITIAWYANFERETPHRPSSRLYYRPSPHTLAQALRAADIKPSILWDNMGKMLFLSLPPPMLGIRQGPNAIARFIGVKDNGKDSEMAFQSDRNVMNMALYESNMKGLNKDGQRNEPQAGASDQLWVSLPDGKLLAISRNGNVSKVIDLSKMLNANFTITSKMMTVKSRDVEEDFLIFGIHVPSKSDTFRRLAQQLSGGDRADSDYYIVGYDTPENLGLPLAWMIPTPDNMPVTGQIVGVPGTEAGAKDRIVAFAGDAEAAKLFSISTKS